MGGKQSTAARSRGPFPGVSTDDSAVPPPGGAPHFGHYRAGGGAMGLRSRSVSSVAGMGMDPSTAGGVPFGLYTPASRGTGDSERAPGGGGSASDSTYAHGNGYQETGGGHHRDGMLYLGSRASLADALPLHIAPRWFSSHSGFKCPICSKSVASDEMEMHFIMCLSKPRLSYNGKGLAGGGGVSNSGSSRVRVVLGNLCTPLSGGNAYVVLRNPTFEGISVHQLERQPSGAGRRPRGQARGTQKSLGCPGFCPLSSLHLRLGDAAFAHLHT
uniref:RING-type E3 ubiquitin transferase n=1 Tax=Panthera leo TaxID=9689 RepID=A0A8C8XU14_PANLE